MQPGGDDIASGGTPVGERLRVLGLFSLPEGGQPLSLRRERQALVGLLTRIAGRAADVRVLQYGVTRDRLRDVLEEDEGWDVIHISGHGAPGELLLETAAGLPDRVTAEELAGLLRLARERVKLVTVSACWSAALAVAQQRRLLGLALLANARGTGVADRGDQFAPGALATRLARRLGCAVLAMRYPVADDFAIDLSVKLYELLASEGRTLPRALGMALTEIAGNPATANCPALSAGTPVLVGFQAVNLQLMAPARARPEPYDTKAVKMAGFEPQPGRFVGRTGVMARASGALAAESGRPGVLLHGMPGGGKTACALELAYTHELAFDRLVWFEAPSEGKDITGALDDFALVLERSLQDFEMVHVLKDPASFGAFLPRLSGLMEQRRVLIVVDNIGSLLADSGQWRDARWGQVIAALCGHAGLGRVLLTSRRLPTDVTGLLVEAVDAMSPAEALLLVRELPDLQALIRGKLAGVEGQSARMLARAVLEIAQGHPKLLELADGQAADPAGLVALVQEGGQAWQQAGGLPDGFFASGASRAAADDYLHVLDAWTAAVSDALAPGHRNLFWFLCCLEDVDRIRPVAEASWPRLWDCLKRPGQPPEFGAAVAVLATRSLLAVQPGPGHVQQAYRIHPWIAAAGRAQAGKDFQSAVDAEVAATWEATLQHALRREDGGHGSSLVVRAGTGAAPYLMRLGEWSHVTAVLQEAFGRDRSRSAAAAILPALRAVAATGQEPDASRLLAKVLQELDPDTAEARMRAQLADAEAGHDYRAATETAENLSYLYRQSGRLLDALTLAEQMADYTRLAGLGPWTQLSDDVKRLEILSMMGRAGQVLDEVLELRERMRSLPAASGNEAVPPWDVRESLLRAGRDSALRLRRFDMALDLNAAIMSSQRDRDAPALVIARDRFNDYGPLIRLGRMDEALSLLRGCRKVFEEAAENRLLGYTLGALAELEARQGHGDVAIRLQRDCLRYAYLAPEAVNIAAGHRNLGHYLGSFARQPQVAAAFAHHLADALIRDLAGTGDTDESLRSAAADLKVLDIGTPVPADLEDLCRHVAAAPGVHLAGLLGTLAPGPRAQQAFKDLTARARDLAGDRPILMAGLLASWDPVISAILAAFDGDAEAAAALDQELSRRRDSADWSGLAAALRRVRDGETGPELLTGLDYVKAKIVTRALDARSGEVLIPAGLWPAMDLSPLLGDMVRGAWGDVEAGGRARHSLGAMAEDPERAQLANALDSILEGNRAQKLAAQLTNPMHTAVATTVLRHIDD